jgi:hypothetical protein
MISQTKPSNRQSAMTAQPLPTGRDEMNLAEFPVTKLGSRDQREVLTYEGWAVGADKKPYRQAWTVRGATGLGLPAPMRNVPGFGTSSASTPLSVIYHRQSRWLEM